MLKAPSLEVGKNKLFHTSGIVVFLLLVLSLLLAIAITLKMGSKNNSTSQSRANIPIVSTNVPLSGQLLIADNLNTPKFVSLSGDAVINSTGVINFSANSVGSSEITNSGVTPGIYGSATDYPVFTVDSDGRITSASTLTFPEGGSGVGSLNTLVGALTLQGTANQISVISSGTIITLSTPQDIASVASPTFAGLTLNTPLAVANGGTGSNTVAGARSNLSVATLGVNSDITQLTGLTTALSISQGGTGSATAVGASIRG